MGGVLRCLARHCPAIGKVKVTAVLAEEYRSSTVRWLASKLRPLMAITHTNSLISTSVALQRVFLCAKRPLSLRTSRDTRTSTPPCHRIPSSGFFRPDQYRNASTGVNIRYGTTADDIKGLRPRQSPNRPPRDEEIRTLKIYMVNENGRLTEPILTSDALDLRARDEKGRLSQYLQVVAGLDAEVGRYFPICRMFDIKAQLEYHSEKKKVAKEKKLVTKQLECSWAMSSNDLGYRLERLKEFLRKGWRVEILFGTKRKGWQDKRAATRKEITTVLAKIRAAVNEVEGAKELKEMQGKEGGEAMLAFEGKAKKPPSPA